MVNVVKVNAVVLTLISTLSFAQVVSFEYKRKVKDVLSDDWYGITLPADLFQHLNREFSDLRIYSFHDNDTLEVPYLLKIKADETSEEIVKLPILNLSQKDGQLFFTVKIPDDKQVNVLHLDFNEKNFDGKVTLEGSHDRREWFEIVTGKRVLSIQEGAVDFTSTAINFPLSTFPYLRAAIRSNVSLTLLQAYFKNTQTEKGEVNSITPYSIAMENKKQQTIATIKLDVPVPVTKVETRVKHDIDFYRNFTLEYLYDSVQTQKGWVCNYHRIRSGYLTSVKPNVFEFAPVVAGQFKITINNHDNPPLTVEQIDLYGPTVELVAKLKPGNNYLYYGNKNVRKPAYDLVHFSDKIPSELLTASLLPEERTGPVTTPPSPIFQNKLWLWGLMALIIGILGYFTLRMLSAKQS